MDAPTRDRLVQEYLKGPTLLRQAIAGMSVEQLKSSPVPGKWSTLDVLCHIADFEPVYAERMKRALAMDNPPLLGADESQFAKNLCYNQRDAQEELTLIEVTRQQIARILRSIPLAAWERTGNHNERGPMTVEKMVTNITNHIPHHVKFIQEKRQALGL